jgi:hypothetical protein
VRGGAPAGGHGEAWLAFPDVSGGGLIFAAILVGWAVFLLPQWLRRDPEVELDVRAGVDPDDVDPDEGTDAADLAWADDTPRHRRLRLPQAVRLSVSRLAAGRPDVAAPHSGGQAPRVTAAGAAAQRRRRILAGLVAATVLVAGAAAAGLVPQLLVALPAGLLVGYLALLVAAGRRAARVRATPAVLGGRLPSPAGRPPARASQRGAAGRPGAAPATDEQATGPVPTYAGALPGTAAVPVAAHATTGMAAAAGAARPAAGQPVPSEPAAAADSSWRPVQVPLPTYVTAPKARRTIRSIDLGTPGSWTSGRLDPAEAETYAASFAERGVRADDDPAAIDDPAARPGGAAGQRAVGG